MKQITIAGNVVRDAETRTTQGGDKVCNFSVAVNDRQNNATFFGCSLWGKRGDALCQYLTKGTPVTVIGDFSTREYEGKTYLEVRVSEVALRGGRRREEQPRERFDAGSGPDLDGDSIPFAPEVRL